jgi:hypothetical protein
VEKKDDVVKVDKRFEDKNRAMSQPKSGDIGRGNLIYI